MATNPNAPRILRLVAFIDLALGVACIVSPLVSSRFGDLAAYVIALPLFAGSLFCFWYASRLERPKSSVTYTE